MKSKRKVIRWIVRVGVCALAVPFLLSLAGLLPWSPVNCWHYEVDIHSGRIRYTRYFAFIPITQRVDESALSRELQPEDLRYPEPDWRRVHTFSPGVRNSPHYIFHSAINQIKELELVWRIGEFTPAARRSSVKRVLELWQQGQSDDDAKPYLRAISDLAFRLESENRSIDLRDLPAVY